MSDLSGDIQHGHYAATGTVHGDRRNLFNLKEGSQHHIGTLVSGSKSKVTRFDQDCDKIVRGLHMLELHDTMLAAMKGVIDWNADINGDSISHDVMIAAVKAAIAKAEGESNG